MQKKWDAYVYGDVNIDLVVPGVERLPAAGVEEEVATMETFVGGGAALFALGLAKLGLRPAFQGSVGDDMYGGYIRRVFRDTGIDDEPLSTDPVRKTGISISFTNERDRCFLTYRGTNEGIALEKMDLDRVRCARHVHVTGYAGRANHEEYLRVLRRVRALGDVTVSLDAGWDVSGEWYEGIYELMPMIDVLFMNETECLHYTRCETAEAGAKKLADHAGMAVVKLGGRGAMAARGGEVSFAPAYRVTAVDTTGAGDSFNAGFIYAFLSGMDLENSLRCGNACGAMSVTKLGGNTGFPNRAALERWLDEH